ncbi:hypothetical protein MSG28_013226 [Choristoneura fumiferana]|uniref:Uncharacterized protein n=1 Tax=Choristoneura fumiferana TaxID=7141 RepID=A0ACC0KT00_CHOFU|nr:hypothetical protein MSG28_013226 [Choristoneura fumiferana]
MSSPVVLLNNLVQEEDSSYIDPISKGFILTEAVIGFNRLAVFGKIKPIFVILASVYTFFICGAILFMVYYRDLNGIYAVVIVMDGMAYIICVSISALMWKRLQLYFNELQKFDRAVGCRPKRTASSIKNVIQMFIEIILMIQSVPYEWYVGSMFSVHQVVERMIYITEVHFCGHLLSLLVPRLRLINYYMKMSLNDNKQVTSPKVEKLPYFKANNLETQNCQMKKLMELYCIIISAYDLLIEAIKWQFLLVLTSAFISILAFSYIASLLMIRGLRPFAFVVTEWAFMAIRMFPMFAPCMFSDQIHDEVRRLRELLASRLYENKLNKAGRSVARALLALTEARNLSFSLLQIFDIDISLPFKFMGLLLTYLIILLQFEKVINP